MAKSSAKHKRKRISRTIASSSEPDSPSSSDDSHSLSSTNDHVAVKPDLSDVELPDGLDIDSLPEVALNVGLF
jgi:hypothetical protein